MHAALIAAFLAVPALALVLERRFAWAARLGTIVLCYAAGLLVGNLGVLPEAAAGVQKTLSEVTIALGLPMILFTVDLRAWSRIAGKALLSMALASVSILAVAVALFAIYRANDTPAAYELAGLAVGVYTGGTPNLAAIKAALGVDDARFVLFNAFDTVVSAVYLMVMMSSVRPIAARWLRAAVAFVPAASTASPTPLASRDRPPELARSAQCDSEARDDGAQARADPFDENYAALLASLGLAASLIPAVRALAESYKVGMYLIYVFSFTVASTARLDTVQASDLALFGFVAAAVFASFALHLLLCRVARVDVDTFLVTSVSAICSPAFVPMVARQLSDRTMLVSGIGTGIIGYAIGTQLGIAVALVLRNFG